MTTTFADAAIRGLLITISAVFLTYERSFVFGTTPLRPPLLSYSPRLIDTRQTDPIIDCEFVCGRAMHLPPSCLRPEAIALLRETARILSLASGRPTSAASIKGTIT